MSKTNTSYYAILGILGFGPMSGYSIKMWVEEGVGYFWDIDYKQIYPTLKKFLDEELATFKIEKTGNRPESKIYTLTDKGFAELKNWLIKPIPPGKKSRNELMLKLFFGHHIPLRVNLAHLQRFKETTLASIKAIREIKDCLEKEEIKDASWHYRLTTVMNGELIHQASIDWCNKAAEHLLKLENGK
ncbi:MAG: PadR family transcriptional regulator [Clostridia bacterium]|nr:PadR family transcriptional regulator [Clostridia bacterium]